MGEEERALLSPVQCPQLFMPAGADAASCKAGGLAEEVLGDLLEVVEFPSMEHGWSIRGGLATVRTESGHSYYFSMF